LSWLDVFATASVWVCSMHILIYFIVSTLIDYAWKAIALRNMLRAPLHAVSSPVRNVMEQAARDLRIQAQFGFRDFRTPSTSDDDLNVCVQIRRLLGTPVCHWALLATVLLCLLSGFVLAVSQKTRHAMLLAILGLSALLTLANFKCRASSRELTEKFESIGGSLVGTGATAKPWALWFRTNCGVSPLAIFAQELGILAISVSFAISAVEMRLWVLFAICVPVLCWSICLMAVSVCYSERLWVWVFAERLVFGAVSLFVASSGPGEGVHRFGMTEGVWSALALILLTQLGMWRKGSTHSHALSVGFFVIIAIAIFALSLMASSSTTGRSFANMGFDWCVPGAAHCKEFQFPLHGQRNHSYEFCGMSWPMGTGGTVSDRCQDTRLSIVDFGQISTTAGFLPNTTRVAENVEKYLPGWEVRKVNTYNLTANTTTSFLHLSRGSTSVIAVRGTSSAVEVLQDLNLWMRIGFLQLARKVGPSCYSARGILKAFTRDRSELMGRSFEDLFDYVQNVSASRTNRTAEVLYITGHSLGGGLATVVGAILDIPAVTFSAPGLEATSAILQPSPPEGELLRRGVNVAPLFDLVPMVDQQTGSTLRVACPRKSPLQCHRLRNTMCELLSSCGDGGGRGHPRGYNRSCEACAHSGQPLPEICSLP